MTKINFREIAGYNHTPATQKTLCVCVDNAYEIKDYLKARGYRWDGVSREWVKASSYKDATSELLTVVMDNDLPVDVVEHWGSVVKSDIANKLEYDMDLVAKYKEYAETH